MSKFTSGPWVLMNEEDKGYTVSVSLGSSGISVSAYPADARLIAAAPDLLEAAREALESLELVSGTLERLGISTGATSVETLKIAIAKAESK